MDEIKVGFSATDIQTGVRLGKSSLDEFMGHLLKVDASLRKMTQATLTTMTKVEAELKAISKESLGGLTEVSRNALSALTSANGKTLQLVKGQNLALQVAYEQRLASQGLLQDQELRSWKSLGASIGKLQSAQLAGFKIHTEVMRMEQLHSLATLEAGFKRSTAMSRSFTPPTMPNLSGLDISKEIPALLQRNKAALSLYATEMAQAMRGIRTGGPDAFFGLVSGDSVVSEREMRRVAASNLAQLEAHAAAVGAAKLEHNKFYGNIANAKLAQEQAHYTATMAEMRAHYAQMEATAVADLAAKRSIAVENGVIAKARLDQDLANQALLKAETIAFYTQMEAAAVADLAAKRSIAVQNGVIAKARLDQDAANQALLKAETIAFYTQMEATAVADLAAKRSIAVQNGIIAKARLDQTQQNNAAELTAMRVFYTQMQQEAAKASASRIAKATAFAPNQMSAAMRSPAGSYQQYDPSSGGRGEIVKLNEELKKTPAHAAAASKGFQQLAIDGNDVHSMARGLASGFNLLWLTWGNLAPLFVGAAISNGFMQTAKTGMAVAHTMEIISVLGGNTKDEMVLLNDELTRLGKSGPFGPIAIADAMKTLSLAGLKANEILAVTQDVLNFSVAGTTDLKTAADTLVSISTAFGMGAEGFNRVGDVIAKAAAESKASVESVANAMKTASVINAQYGVSLEDTATGIATLSQLGIEGTAAGTALRNMYADLSGRSIIVAKTLKAQGIEMRTATGEFRPMLEVVADLNEKLQKMDGISQKNLMQALLSERGAKGIVEMLRLINTEAKNAGAGMSNALEEMRASIAESYGFAAVSAAKLSQTTENQFKAVKATAQTSMNEAFQQMQPALLLIADGLKKAFGSPEFVATLGNLVTGVAQLGLVIVENAKIIGIAIAAYAALKLSKFAVVAATEAMILLAGSETAATELNTAAQLRNNAAKAAGAGALLGMARVIPYIGTAVAVGTTAWMAWEWWVGKSTDAAQTASDLYNNNVSKDLNDQATKLETINNLRRTGLSLAEAEAKFNLDRKGAEAAAPARAQFAAAFREETAARKALREEETNPSMLLHGDRLVGLKTRVRVAVEATRSAMEAEHDAAQIHLVDVKRLQEASRESAKITEAEVKARKEKNIFGDGKFELGAGAGKKAEHDKQLALDKKAADLRLKTVEHELRQEEDLLRAGYDAQMFMLDSLHKNKLISDAQYQNDSLVKIEDYETAAQQVRDKAYDDYLNAIVDREDELRKTLSGDALEVAIDELNLRWSDFTAKIDKADFTQATNAFKRVTTATNTAAGAMKQLDKDFEKFWADDAIELQKAVGDISYSMDEYANVAAKAGAEASAKYAKQLNILELEALKAAEALALLNKSSSVSPEAVAQAETFLADIQARIATFKAQASSGIAQAQQTAINKLLAENSNKLAGSLTDAVMEGIENGGAAGAKKLRQILTDELLKKPFRMLVQTMLQPIAQGIVSSMAGGAVQGAGSSMFGSLAGSTGGSMLGGITLGGSTIAAIGSSVATGISAGFAGTSLAPAVAAYTTAGATGVATGLSAGSAIGTALAAIGPVGWAAIAVAALAYALDDSGTPHTGGFGDYSKAGGAQLGSGSSLSGKGTSGWDMEGNWSPSINKQAVGFAQGGVGILDSVSTAFGGSGGYKISTGFADDKSKDKSWGALNISNAGGKVLDWNDTRQSNWAPKEFSDGESGVKEYAAAYAKSLKAALMSSVDMPTWAKTIFEGLPDDADLDTITEAARQVTTLQAEYKAFGDIMNKLPFPQLRDMSFEAAQGLMAATGGFDNFASSLSSFYDNFYTETEKTANLAEGTAMGFAALGVAMPEVNEGLGTWYRTQVEAALALDQSIPANAQATAGLLALNGSVKSLATGAETAAQNIRKMVQDIAKIAADNNFERRYGLADNAGKYGMMDVKNDTLKNQMLAEAGKADKDVFKIGQMGTEMLANNETSWNLLSPEQQTKLLPEYEARDNWIKDFVAAQGADAISLQGARDEALAARIEAAVAKGLAASAAKIEAAGAAMSTAAEKPAEVNLSVTVTKPQNVEVSIMDGNYA